MCIGNRAGYDIRCHVCTRRSGTRKRIFGKIPGAFLPLGCDLWRRYSSLQLLDVNPAQNVGNSKPQRAVVERDHFADCVVGIPPIDNDPVCGNIESDSIVAFPTMNKDGPVFRILNHPEEWYEIILRRVQWPHWNPDVFQLRSCQEFSVIVIMSNVDNCPDSSFLQIPESFGCRLRASPQCRRYLRKVSNAAQAVVARCRKRNGCWTGGQRSAASRKQRN